MKQPRKRRDFCIEWKAFFYICVCLINYLLCVNTSVHVCRCLGIHMCIPWQHEHGIRGQFVGICFFLPLCEFQGSNIGSQASQQAPLYSEPLCWPSKMYLWIKRHHRQRWNSSASSKGKGASPHNIGFHVVESSSYQKQIWHKDGELNHWNRALGSVLVTHSLTGTLK